MLSKQDFTIEDENVLATYLHRAADIYFGVSPHEARKLAYQYAVKLNVKIPLTWSETTMDGAD